MKDVILRIIVYMLIVLGAYIMAYWIIKLIWEPIKILISLL